MVLEVEDRQLHRNYVLQVNHDFERKVFCLNEVGPVQFRDGRTSEVQSSSAKLLDTSQTNTKTLPSWVIIICTLSKLYSILE